MTKDSLTVIEESQVQISIASQGSELDFEHLRNVGSMISARKFAMSKLLANETLVDKTIDRLVDESFLSGDSNSTPAEGDQISDFKEPESMEKERKGFEFNLDSDRSARINIYHSEEKTEKTKTRTSLF
jgi:hypothetical protein